MKKYSFLLILWFFCGFSGQTFSGEKNLLQLIQTQYQSIQSFSGHFVQTSHREEQLLVTNGETLWLFDPLLENVTVQKLAKLTDGTALSFLLGLGDLNADFKRRKISKSLLENPDGLIVELVPNKETANLAFIQLEVHPETYNLQKIALMDQQGNYRTIALESINYNLVLEDKFFEFEVTPDMEVIEVGN